jgi:hypothetical protein
MIVKKHTLGVGLADPESIGTYIIFIFVLLCVLWSSLYPDVHIMWYMHRHHITLRQVLDCHSMFDCKSLDKYQDLKCLLKNDRD